MDGYIEINDLKTVQRFYFHPLFDPKAFIEILKTLENQRHIITTVVDNRLVAIKEYEATMEGDK